MPVKSKKTDKTEFNWHGKTDSVRFAASPAQKSFHPQKAKSINWNNTENVYIEGDNLEALKLLRKEYSGKIKVIYIDPPYNTGKDFTYHDRFKHSDWCSMIYPRLKLARELMSDDGIIFISIDDNELCNLKNLCEDIFGEENFVTQFVYEKTQHFGRQKLNTYSNAEYILCYAKSLYGEKLKELLVEKINTGLVDAPLYNASNNLSVITFPPKTVKFNIKDGVYEKTETDKYQLLSRVEVKNGKNKNEFSLKFKSRWSQKKVLDEIKNGTTFWIKSKNFAVRAVYGDGKSAKTAPKQIIFTNKTNKFCTVSRFGKYVTTNETASKELENLIKEAKFSYPKPISLISYLLSLIYDYKSDKFDNEFTVLDFFSGSGTTAHAVMELNALDCGKRKFILVQKPEPTDKESEAYKSGLRNICELGEERIKRAIHKIKQDYPDSVFDDGFRVYKISD